MSSKHVFCEWMNQDGSRCTRMAALIRGQRIIRDGKKVCSWHRGERGDFVMRDEESVLRNLGRLLLEKERAVRRRNLLTTIDSNYKVAAAEWAAASRALRLAIDRAMNDEAKGGGDG